MSVCRTTRPRRCALIAALLPLFAFAQSPVRLPEVRVTGTTEETAASPAGGYAAKRSATATKTDTPLAETPQAVTVVTRERIEDQAATSLQDALNYAAGVRSDAYGLDSRTDSVRVRGGYPDEYRDGLRRLFGYYTSTTRIEPYMLERIEVLRGPAAMLYGQGSTAGLVNAVSKRPLAEAVREVGFQFGSFGRKQVQADLTGPLTEDGKWLYRVVALARDADTQVDYVPDDRRLLAPSLTWRPSAATTLTLQANWQQDASGSTSQFFPFSGVITPNPNGALPTNRFIGEPGFDRYDSRRAEAGWLFEHRFDERWTLRQNTRYSDNKVDYRSLYSDSFSNPSSPYIDPAQRVLDRFAFAEKRHGRLLATDQHLEGRFATGALRHQLLAGVDALSFRETSSGAQDFPPAYGGTAPPIDAYDPVYNGFSLPDFTDGPRTRNRQVGIYLQDQVRIGERWIAVGGLRHDRATSQVEGSPDDEDRATTRRGGLMYLTASGWSPYLGYSESFTPIAGLNPTTLARFKPMRGEQWELGVKYAPEGSRHQFTAAAYDLEEKNRTVEIRPNVVEQVGRTRTRGVEIEYVGEVAPGVEVASHYNWTEVDEQLEALPEHQAAVWGTWRFSLGGLAGFKAGLGVRHLAAFRDGTAPQSPAVTLGDAMVSFEAGPWRLALNAQNLADKVYVATCLARGDCWFGARRTLVGSVTYRF